MKYTLEDTTFDRFLELESYYDMNGIFGQKAKLYIFSNFSINSEERKLIQHGTPNSKEGKIVKEKYKYIKDERFSSINQRNKAFYNDDEKCAFGGNFDEFMNWWLDGIEKGKGVKCSYCGSTETDWIKIIDRRTIGENDYRPGHLHKSKKGSSKNGKDIDIWGNPVMEIDKINPGDGYYKDNCVFACHLCNNAKSDLIEGSDFKKYFSTAISDYIKELTK